MKGLFGTYVVVVLLFVNSKEGLLFVQIKTVRQIARYNPQIIKCIIDQVPAVDMNSGKIEYKHILFIRSADAPHALFFQDAAVLPFFC